MNNQIVFLLGILILTFFIGCSIQSDSPKNVGIDPNLTEASGFVISYTYNKYYYLDENYTLFNCVYDLMRGYSSRTTKRIDFDNVYAKRMESGLYLVTFNFKVAEQDTYFSFETDLNKVYSMEHNSELALTKLAEVYERAANELSEWNQEYCDKMLDPNIWKEYKGKTKREVWPEDCDGKIFPSHRYISTCRLLNSETVI